MLYASTSAKGRQLPACNLALPTWFAPPALQVLIIHGQADALVPVGNSTRLAAMLPGAELVVLPACGHVPQEEQPRQFVGAIVDFLDQKQREHEA